MPKPVLLACGAAAALLAGLGFREVTGAAPVSSPAPAASAAPTDLLSTPSPEREAVATALRAGDTAAALRRLEPDNPTNEPRGADTRLLLGLASHSRARMADAERWLRAGNDGELVRRGLADWRLFVLADAAAAVGQRAEAIAALDQLLADFPASPLAPRSRLRLIELLVANGDETRAIAAITAARDAQLSGEDAIQIEKLAWQVGSRLGDRQLQMEAAKRLLVSAPIEASRLQVAQVFPGADWAAALSAGELERRAESLLALEMVPNADQTLAEVAPGARGIRWHILKAVALTAAYRAAEACDLLAAVTTEDAAERVRLDWARAQAAGAAATAVRGRANPPASVRATYRKLEEELLQRAAARAAADPEIGRLALRALYADYEADDRYEESVATLERLKLLDPRDMTGARHLWERGWREYRGRNYTGAVGHWAELHELYPKSAHDRSARYWTARAFAALGNATRAQDLLREVAAARPVDFYARQAAARLARHGGGPPGEESVASEPWPEDPLLARARLLTDLGLDELAVAEIDLLAGRAEPRSELALRGVALARLGERRESIRLLRRAFPKLGTAFQSEEPREAIALFYPLDFAETIQRIARAQQLPTPLVLAVIHQESAFDPQAVSRSGARGLMQVMPATGRELARQLGLPFTVAKLHEPEISVRLGTTYLRQVLSMFGGNVELALAGYNGGPNRIRQLWRRAGTAPELDSFLEGLSVEESKNYVKRILVLADGYRQLYPNLS